MSVMGQACVIVYYTYIKDYAEQSNDYPLILAIFLAALVILITAFGRVYLGVHSIPDLVGGFFFEVRGDCKELAAAKMASGTVA